MSCHDIGHGMASVANVVLDLYESGQINKDAAIHLVNACRNGVNWCDGNENEAFESVVEAGYCGLCFEKKEDLSNIYDNDLGYRVMYEVFRAYDNTAAHYILCPDCKAKVIAEWKAKHSRQ